MHQTVSQMRHTTRPQPTSIPQQNQERKALVPSARVLFIERVIIRKVEVFP